MHITIEIRTTWGTERANPICNTARAFARIAGTETLTMEALAQVKNLGYSVKEQVSSSSNIRKLID